MAPPDVEGNFAIMLGLLDKRTTVLRGRVLAAWNAINTLEFVDKKRIGSVGFCYGGIPALGLTRFNVDLTAAVTMFGSLTNYPDPRSNATLITASIQVHHGDIDKYTKNEDVEAFLGEMRARREITRETARQMREERGCGTNARGMHQYEESVIDYTAHPSLDSSGQILEGLLIHDKNYTSNNKAPAIIIFHTILGKGQYEDGIGRYLASLGYVVFVADFYGKGQIPPDVDGKFAKMKGLMEDRTTILRGRILAAWNIINSLDFVDKQRIGSIGFCYGTVSVLDLTRFNVGLTAAVSFFGEYSNYPDTQSNTTHIPTSIQIHHGDWDFWSKNHDVDALLRELRARQTDWWVLRYAEAERGFTIPGSENTGFSNTRFNPIAARRSWGATEIFLAEKLKPNRANN
ncbi:hypothetical protein WR25_02321 [Diploscapter pachys]|uniref:Dienelactone hydrolase domain-containing protein n=1 Tax=Diploscapter pachys TaxID=2018661 RepID=A0A2A2LC94_9BILA|nr:hypothetical protein WR25_02321 [Diploscapter pachys]